MILITQRLTLRPLTSGDDARLHALMSDPKVMAFWDSVQIADPATTAEILERQLGDIAAGAALHWAMARSADAAFVGVIDLSDIDAGRRRAEIGFMLAKPFWGLGYAREASHAVISHAALTLRLKALSARAHLGNERSISLLEQLGFQREGVLRGSVERDGARRDCLMFGLPL